MQEKRDIWGQHVEALNELKIRIEGCRQYLTKIDKDYPFTDIKTYAMEVVRDNLSQCTFESILWQLCVHGNELVKNRSENDYLRKFLEDLPQAKDRISFFKKRMLMLAHVYAEAYNKWMEEGRPRDKQNFPDSIKEVILFCREVGLPIETVNGANEAMKEAERILDDKFHWPFEWMHFLSDVFEFNYGIYLYREDNELDTKKYGLFDPSCEIVTIKRDETAFGFDGPKLLFLYTPPEMTGGEIGHFCPLYFLPPEEMFPRRPPKIMGCLYERVFTLPTMRSCATCGKNKI